MSNDTQKLIDEYSKDYCLYLEATYGANMMSEGGEVALNNMFAGTELYHKNILDIGSGLGGVAFFVAQHYQANVLGLELSDWMVFEAQARTPENLKSRVSFTRYQPPNLIFDDADFDDIYSKGVFTHVKDKQPLFDEIFRVLKPGGELIIVDWLSPYKDHWGKRIQKMCEMENLTLYAETEENYQEILNHSGFEQITIQDENKDYTLYNLQIVQRLQTPEISVKFGNVFSGITQQQAIKGYQLIADALQDNELLIRKIKCKKIT